MCQPYCLRCAWLGLVKTNPKPLSQSWKSDLWTTELVHNNKKLIFTIWATAKHIVGCFREQSTFFMGFFWQIFYGIFLFLYDQYTECLIIRLYLKHRKHLNLIAFASIFKEQLLPLSLIRVVKRPLLCSYRGYFKEFSPIDSPSSKVTSIFIQGIQFLTNV